MILKNILLIAVAVMVMGLLLAGAFRLFRLLFSYRIADDGITVLLFHIIPIYRIPFRKIKQLREASVYEVALVPGMHLFTRPFARRVVIEMRDTWVKFAFLTPDNPAAFIADIKRHAAIP